MTQKDAADKPLTARQEAFCREYVIDLNATQAAIRAGYSEKGATVRGSELLAIRKVADRVAELSGVKAERAALDAQTVLEGLLMEARGEGPDTASSARLRAWELVGKHLGMWRESKEDGKRSGLDDLVAFMREARSNRQDS